MLWVKLHVGIHRNPKIRRGGRDVRDLFVLLLCINGEHDFGGVIPAAYCAPDLLADDLGVTHETAGNALKRGETVGLFQRNEAGDLAISGFSDEWMPIKGSSTERVRAFRARHRNHTDETIAVTHETVTETPSVSHETRNGDKSRLDKKRSDKSVAAPQLVAGPALEVAQYLLEAIRSHKPDAKGDPGAWAKDIDLAIRVDGRTVEGLKRAVDQAHRSADPFWRPNLLSGKALRKQCERLEIKAAQQTLGGQRDVRVGSVAVTGREVYAGGEVKI
jgi:hypothetical protein